MYKLSFIFVFLWSFGFTSKGQELDFENVPGTVVVHYPASSKTYIGSPSLVELPNGDYLASYDIFGARTTDWLQAETNVYRSKNKGKTWRKLSTIEGALWSSLFVHRDTLYLLGPDRVNGSIMIRKSSNGGKTWTIPTNKKNGVLLTGAYHCAPVPIVEYNGRLWRPVETAHGPNLDWGKRFGAMVMSADVNSDLLDAKSWRTTNALLFNSKYMNGKFGGWMEGNFVVDKNGKMMNLLRVDNQLESKSEYLALTTISSDGKKLSFNKDNGFIPFEGGSKKFSIKYDSVSRYYWTLVNPVLPKYKKEFPNNSAFSFRNVLVLRKSKDLINWEDVKVVLENKDVLNHAFQYADWLIEDNNIIFLSRTAFFDGKEDAKNFHNANFLTFHRITNFRDL